MTSRFSRLRILLAALVGLVPPIAQAGSAPPENVVQAEILGGWTTGDGTRMAALHIRLAPGWKTYWRAPGETGIPPHFDWSGSENLRGVRYHWPSPRIFDAYGARTIGYAEELVLPIELYPEQAGAPIRLRGDVDLGICETICMPASLKLDARLQGDGGSDPKIHKALASQPRPARRAGVNGVSCDLEPISDGLRLEATIEMPRLPGEEIALVEAGDPRIWVSQPMVKRQGSALHVEADLVPPNGKPMALQRSALRFTVIAGANAVDIRGCKGR
ncbi:protein-disulfide reductase DsbD family protein [Tropicimonas sp. TH_r6]|uniref:protein-disulfide reductase DsbD domain-containing protein n=1 Tax=Tropicimonas sp. TH_r6 TaxID=3082085 RepID=UPI00295543D5|nr:protein-disulfide reductase DsbD domain-containing protein [Tropicimonas sp. TH_r6]MDV7142224.1 protein-disulfide reductase DsbD family protein [Tropicimonas sp. TH_r6]